MKKLKAVLNDEGGLIGLTEPTGEHGEILVPAHIDLPMDGTFKWSKEDGQFLRGDVKIRRAERAPVAAELVLYQALQAMKGVVEFTPEMAAWSAWFNKYRRKALEARVTERRPKR